MLSVRYEDEFLLALDKAPGIDTAPLSGGRGEGSLLEEAMDRYPDIARLPGRKACEPGLLHRLDRDTSGLVLIAKTKEAFERLMAAQESRLFVKRYSALCAASKAELPGAKPERGRLEQGCVLSRFRAYGPKGARVAPLGQEIAAPGPVYRTRVLSSTESQGIFSFAPTSPGWVFPSWETRSTRAKKRDGGRDSCSTPGPLAFPTRKTVRRSKSNVRCPRTSNHSEPYCA